MGVMWSMPSSGSRPPAGAGTASTITELRRVGRLRKVSKAVKAVRAIRERGMGTGWEWPTMAVAVLALAACSDEPVQWRPSASYETPEVADTQEDLLRARCASLASERAEQDYALSQPTVGDEYGRTLPYREAVDRYDAGKYKRKLFDRCMQQNTVGDAPAGAAGAPPPPVVEVPPAASEAPAGSAQPVR